MASMQFEAVRSSVRDITMRFQKLNPSNQEIQNCFEVLYKGRDFRLISTSENIRAGLEISGMINRQTGLRLPVFIDNAESITHYDKPDAQIFEVRVEKHLPLTVSECTD